MEELEKEINESCGCCPGCNCGEDCKCTEDNKCCEECTCGVECNCHNDKCDCDSQDTCEEEMLSDECIRDEDNCQTGDCVENEDEINECEKDCNCKEEFDEEIEELDDGKCKCGCGESATEESTADAYFRQLLSLRAEFDNYRKRTQNDISKAYSNGFNQAITEFLPALDSFKMATEYITDPNTLMGIQYIEKGILNTLEKIGVKAIDVSGKFDPNFHQAIGSETSPEHESGDIIKECFKGFIMGEKVIRYSQVIVAK